MIKKIITSLIILSSIISPSYSQSLEDKFYQAEEHLEYGRFDQAIEILELLYQKQPQSAHFAYKLGLAHLKNHSNRKKSIPYLEQAVKNISGKYDGEFDTKSAPSEALFYLGSAYHLNYQLDEANAILDRFRMVLDPKSEHDLIAMVEKKLEEIKVARMLVDAPIDVEIENLGPRINTPFPEYSPAISADENTLVFTSRRTGSTGGLKTLDNRFFEDIYISYKEEGEWSEPEKINSINSNGHEASISLSANGLSLFVYRDDSEDGFINQQDGNIYYSENKNGKWTTLKKLPKTINTDFWETHAAITPNGKTLYFVSNKEGGYGGRDIYKSELQENGSWGIAQNLGKKINTPLEEDGPFIHPDGKTMYFSSQGHNSMGGFDFFSSELNLETGDWSQPKNIGYPLNTTDDDVFFVLSPDGKRAYYASSNQEDGFGEKDIYVSYMNSINQNCLVVVKGSVKTSTGVIPEYPEIAVRTENDELQGIYIPNSNNGNYILILPSQKQYNITFSADNFASQQIKLNVPDSSCYNEIKQEIKLPLDIEKKTNKTVKKEVEQVEDLTAFNDKAATSKQNIFVLRNVFFDFDKSSLRPESKGELDKLYKFLSENPKLKVEIAGHTDAMGNNNYNLKLSKRRAQAVVSYQIKKGISSNRLAAKGYGENQPIARNANPDGSDNPRGRQLNRRIELRILNADNNSIGVVEKVKVHEDSKLTNTESDIKVDDSKKPGNNSNYKVKYNADKLEMDSNN